MSSLTHAYDARGIRRERDRDRFCNVRQHVHGTEIIALCCGRVSVHQPLSAASSMNEVAGGMGVGRLAISSGWGGAACRLPYTSLKTGGEIRQPCSDAYLSCEILPTLSSTAHSLSLRLYQRRRASLFLTRFFDEFNAYLTRQSPHVLAEIGGPAIHGR